jgi:peptidyl-prolyl cis-trans isomerase SurA
LPENATAEQISAKRARAEEVASKLQAGEDFGRLAVTYSDSAEALKGGDIGWREQDKIPQLFLDAVAKSSRDRHRQLSAARMVSIF